MIGSGVGPRDIYLNNAGLEAQLDRIASNRRPQDITLEYTLPKGKTVNDLTTQFVLSYNGRVTGPMPLSTEAGALYLFLVPAVGFSNFTVVKSVDETTIKTGAQKGSTKVVQNYRIEFSDSVPNVSTKFVVLPPIGGTFKSTVEFDFNDDNAEINAHELALINTPEKRAAFATSVLNQVKQHFAPYNGRVTLHDEDKPGAAYSVDWTSVYEVSRFGRTEPVLPVFKQLEELLKRRKQLNSAQFEFELAAILGGTQTGGVEVYVEQFFARSYPHWDVSQDFVTRALAKTTAHELGHNLGLMHTSEREIDTATDEVQVVDTRLLGPDDFWSLSFAGERTEPISPRATAVEVRDAIRALTAFKHRQAIDVQKNGDAIYTIKFVLPKSATNPDHHFHGQDLPELVLFGPGGQTLFSSVGTTVNGNTMLKAKFEIITTTSSGVQQSTLTDIMASGPVPADTSFQEKTSGAGLNIATRGQWSSIDTKNFLSEMLKIVKYTAKQYKISGFFDAEVPAAGEESADRDSLQFGSSFLELFTADPNTEIDFVGEEIDFGSGSVVTPSIKRFSLANLGGQDATIRSIGITKGIAVFSTPTIPVTMLGPGESLEFDVTFAPDAVLDFDGVLSIDSDLPEFNGEFELVGDGNPPNIPAIRLSASFNTLVPFYNNLGAARVGEQTGFTGGGGAFRGPLVTNNGTAPLVITEIRVAAGQGSGEWTTPALTTPITLQPGQSTGIGFTFTASKLGLRPARLKSSVTIRGRRCSAFPSSLPE